MTKTLDANALRIVAAITRDTILHMAKEAGISAEETVLEIARPGSNAGKRFKAFMAVATQEFAR